MYIVTFKSCLLSRNWKIGVFVIQKYVFFWFHYQVKIGVCSENSVMKEKNLSCWESNHNFVVVYSYPCQYTDLCYPDFSGGMLWIVFVRAGHCNTKLRISTIEILELLPVVTADTHNDRTGSMWDIIWCYSVPWSDRMRY
jgi:hypothetical protein